MKDISLIPESSAEAAGAIPLHIVAEAGFDAWASGAGTELAAFCAANAFQGQKGKILVAMAEDGPVALLGAGAGGDPLLAGAAAAALPPGAYRLAFNEGGAGAEMTALGWALGAYRFQTYKASPAEPAVLVLPDGADGARVTAIAEAVYLVRDLVNTPANDMGPTELEEAARGLADRHGAAFETVEGDRLLTENYPMIHAVGRASTRAPRLIDFTWGGEDAPKLTLVGKGVCFDSGGLNIKPGGAMALMKKDMGGAALTLGLAHMVMALNLPVRLRVLIPAVENSISGDAFRPGDVLQSRKGITVEIGNTDAEGRLVLGDALALAAEEDPDLTIDLATLTGAARVALGADLPALYTDDDGLAADIAAEGLSLADPVWRMPLWPGYESALDSKVADVNHISDGALAGSITAALFLKKFAPASWVHLDVFAWSPKPKPGRPVGGEAQAIRALFAALEKRYAR